VVRPLDAAPPRVAAPARVREAFETASPGSIVLALALPILFLHVQYQPSASLPLGGEFKLQDAAVLLIACAALVTLVREGAGRLRAGLPIWVPAVLLLAWIGAATFYPLASATPYPWRTHLVTAAEFAEYALLAPAVPLLVRRRHDALLVLGVVAAWAAVAVAIAVLQVAGVGILHAWPAGHRQPSFVGSHELSALAGMALGIALIGLLWFPGVSGRRILGALAGVGALGVLLDASAAGVVGVVAAAVVTIAVAARRRLLSARWTAVAVVVVVAGAAGVAAVRGKDVDQFMRFSGLRAAHPSTSRDVQTYSQRTVLAYIGLEVWRAHPLVGAGWEATTDQATIAPVLDAAHARFPDVAAGAFPSPRHEFGIQLLYIEALSDLGVVGFVLVLAAIAVPLALGLRTALRAPPAASAGAAVGCFWLLLAAGLYVGVGFVAGIPTDALLWFSLGTLAAAAAAARRDEDAQTA
jgi:O-antigen ligase